MKKEIPPWVDEEKHLTRPLSNGKKPPGSRIYCVRSGKPLKDVAHGSDRCHKRYEIHTILRNIDEFREGDGVYSVTFSSQPSPPTEEELRHQRRQSPLYKCIEGKKCNVTVTSNGVSLWGGKQQKARRRHGSKRCRKNSVREQVFALQPQPC